jgi:hypothetical protein
MTAGVSDEHCAQRLCRRALRQECMRYHVDWTRALVLLALLGSGMLVATRLVRAPPVSDPTGLARRRIALRGMLLMPLLGLVSGFAGGLAEDVVGETAYVGVLHLIYSVCWAPAFVMARLNEGLSGSDASIRFIADILHLLGLALIPVFWFVAFLGVAQLVTRRRSGSPDIDP